MSQIDFVEETHEPEEHTFVEQLIARLGHHGVLRRTVDEEDVGLLYPFTASPTEENESSALQRKRKRSRGESASDSSKDEPSAPVGYFYYCICCDTQVTPTMTSPPSMNILQDIHFHCSLATHRKAVSWMSDPDCLLTLQNNFPDTEAGGRNKNYIRFFVNGRSVILCRHPGGGPMFNPLPSEAHLYRYDEAFIDTHEFIDGKPSDTCAKENKLSLAPPIPGQAFWYYPMQSLSCHAYQHLAVDPELQGKQDYQADCKVTQNVPWEVYYANSLLVDSCHPVKRSIVCFRKKKNGAETKVMSPTGPVMSETSSYKTMAYPSSLLSRDIVDYPKLEKVQTNEDIGRFLVEDGEEFSLLYIPDDVLNCTIAGTGEDPLSSPSASSFVLTADLLRQHCNSSWATRKKESLLSESNTHLTSTHLSDQYDFVKD